MVHGKNRIPYRIHRRLTGLAGPDITPSSRLACPLSLKTPNMGNPGLNGYSTFQTQTPLCHPRHTLLKAMLSTPP